MENINKNLRRSYKPKRSKHGKHKKKKSKKPLFFLILIIIITFSIIFIKNNKKETNIEPTYSENIEEEIVSEAPTETPEPSPDVEVPSENVIETQASPAEPEPEENITSKTYYLKVNNTANVVNVYKRDENGDYTVPVKAMVCSTGKATPKTGKFKISDKYRWRALFGNVYGQYSSRITGNILFHSVPYTSKRPNSLKYLEYDKLGTAASAGCVRLTVEDVKWIYDYCPQGTRVEFYEDSNPGPLGKPTVQKISSDEERRNWDPTDIWSEGNPWNDKSENKEEI